MGTTLPADFNFQPKVWADHVSAFFPKKLVFGQLAVPDYTLTSQPGTTINFPYFKQIGAAEKPGVSDTLSIDKLTDDSFSATVSEIAKAVGVRKAAFYGSAANQDRISGEIQQQIARVIAEQIDADIITEVNTASNYEQGYTASADTHTASVGRILEGLVTAFGDKQDQAVALFMHSQHFLSIMTDSTAGFLKADANDPFWNMPGFLGRLLGKAVFVSDQVPQGTAISGKRVYQMFAMKANPYGYMVKQDMDLEMDKDILAREVVFAATQWSAVKAFHAKIHAEDKRICRMSFATTMAA